MNERQWLTESDPHALLAGLHPPRTLGSVQPQTRRSRMYLLACARRSWARLPGVCRSLVALAELYADAPRRYEHVRAEVAPVAADLMNAAGTADDLAAAEIELSFMSLPDVWPGGSIPADAFAHAERSGRAPDAPLDPAEWRGLAALVYLPFELYTPAYVWVPPPLHDVRLLRDVYGNPYRHTPFPPHWRTDTAVALARAMYEPREFSPMPILADALQDAGCDNHDILDHCRGGGPHARGCWVLDLILEK